MRVRADYHLRDPYPEQALTLSAWLIIARDLITVLDKLAADDESRTRITDTLTAWRESRNAEN